MTDDLITPEQAVAARDLLNKKPMEIARALNMTPQTIRGATGKGGRIPRMPPRLAKRLKIYSKAAASSSCVMGKCR